MEKINMTPEMLGKAKAAASAEALRTLAQTYHVELTEQEAQTYFEALHDEKHGELSDADLDKVAGGLRLCVEDTNC